MLAALALLLAAASGCAPDAQSMTEPTGRAPDTQSMTEPTGRALDTRPTTEPPRSGPYGPCERGPAPAIGHQPFLHWTPEGSHLVFDQGNTVWALDIENGRLRSIVRVYPKDYPPPFRFHADVSPDGSQIVYSTCEYQLDEPPAGLEEIAGKDVYEIAVVNIDGTGRRRLTETANFDGYPTWSPDGTYAAFPSTKHIRGPVYSAWSAPLNYEEGSLFNTSRLAILAVESGELRWLDSTSRVALYAPVWSPDSQGLAFIGLEGEDYETLRRVLYTVRVDGTELFRIAELTTPRETAAPPSWSPDSGELAFAAVEGEEAVIYVVRPDGSGRREVWRSGADGPSAPITQVSWSPDGTEILFISDRVYVVDADGSDPRLLSPALPDTTFRLHPRDGSPDVGAVRAAWSPDGARVAVYYPKRRAALRVERPLLITVSADGTDLRTLAGAHKDDRDLRVLNPPLPEAPVDLAACSAGVVVPEPESNPGLVRDCEVLLSIRDRLAGGSELNWNERTPIAGWHWNPIVPRAGWDGVIVDGEPPRVLQLWFEGMDRNSARYVVVTGTLPPELSQLSELRAITVAANYLSGSIPPELGELSQLFRLDLGSNFLTGSIPPELRGLTMLEELILSNNFLTGPSPGVGEFKVLRRLAIDNNPLNKRVPPELGRPK